ncbi:MAG: ACP S-malonyltransferase [Clostridiales bacterium]|nr:ACP S-malonyltransferase [Clostridiales bacterium]
MDTVAFVFAGQGEQYPGMGRDLCEASPAAKEVFDLADSIRPGTSAQCFCGTKEELSETVNTQPCVYCVDLAAAQALREAGITPASVAGFSLGEVAALTFAGAFSQEDGFRFVCERAGRMQAAAQQREGAMAAVLKLSAEAVENICKTFDAAYPVNYNCPGQTVVALSKERMPAFTAAVQAAKGRAVPLAVSGGFHSPFMDRAAAELLPILEGIPMSGPRVPVYSNTTAKPYPQEMRGTLAAQVNHPVLWQKTVETMISDGIETFIEVGPGKTLCGLIKKTAPGVRVFHVEDRAGLEEVRNAGL